MSYKKKSLGQHFLIDDAYRTKITDAIIENCNANVLVEIGPGEGSITEKILPAIKAKSILVELDDRFAPQIKKKFGSEKVSVIHNDILKVDWNTFGDSVFICGNFPYNISSQILFKILDHYNSVETVVAMFQKEVAKRVASPKGSKVYGILSVLLAVYYDIEYLFTIPPTAFDPPPKVDSGIIVMKKRKEFPKINEFSNFKKVVKLAFHTRRKKLSNSLKSLNIESDENTKMLLDKRPEHLDVDDFVYLANNINV